MNKYEEQLFTIKDVFLYLTSQFSGKKAMVESNGADGTSTKTYTDLMNDVNCLGTYLYEKGFVGQKKIGVYGENSYNWVMVYLSAVCGENIIVPIDNGLSQEEIEELILHSEVELMFYSDQYKELINGIKELGNCKTVEFVSMETLFSYLNKGEELLKKGNESFLNHTIDKKDIATIVYTSGTTGKSKGVMLTHENITCNIIYGIQVTNLRGRCFHMLPLYHTYSTISLLTCLYVGNYIYINKSMKRVSVEMQKFKPLFVTAVPMFVETMFKKVSELIKKKTISKASVSTVFGGELKLIICGGAMLDLIYEEGFAELGIAVMNGYGISECGPIIAANIEAKYRFGSVGTLKPYCEVKIVGADKDGIGEIYVKGSNVMKGYYKDVKSTEESFEGGWFKTGDLGSFGEDKFLYIGGRKKNLIILSNGKNISPEELESKLLVYIPLITELLVYEEHAKITAEIYIENGNPSLEQAVKEKILEFNKTLPAYKQIIRIKFRDTEFVKTTSRKIKRQYKEGK